jgi:hypothetical protein
MRKRTKLPLTLTVLLIVTGALGASTVLALPSSGSPTVTSYGTIVIGTDFTPSGRANYMDLYIFSTSGPFYVQKVYMQVPSLQAGAQAIQLSYIYFDGGSSSIVPGAGVGFYAHCAVIIPSYSPPSTAPAGDIISVAPMMARMIDPNGAVAIPAATQVVFELLYNCEASIFPSYLQMAFEAVILAPTTATVSICASEAWLTSCSK